MFLNRNLGYPHIQTETQDKITSKLHLNFLCTVMGRQREVAICSSCVTWTKPLRRNYPVMIEQHVATTRLPQRMAKSEERPPNAVMKPKETLPNNPYKREESRGLSHTELRSCLTSLATYVFHVCNW